MDDTSGFHRARLSVPTSEKSVMISSIASRDITDAMWRVIKCAEDALLSKAGFEAFMESLILFKKDQADGTIKQRVKEAVKNYLDVGKTQGVVYYIAEWQPKGADAQHYLPRGLKALGLENKVSTGNVFLFDKVFLFF